MLSTGGTIQWVNSNSYWLKSVFLKWVFSARIIHGFRHSSEFVPPDSWDPLFSGILIPPDIIYFKDIVNLKEAKMLNHSKSPLPLRRKNHRFRRRSEKDTFKDTKSSCFWRSDFIAEVYKWNLAWIRRKRLSESYKWQISEAEKRKCGALNSDTTSCPRN